LHHLRDTTDYERREKQVHMIRHQHIGVYENTMTTGRLSKQLQVKAEVALVEEAGTAIVPALNDV
jgi:hypothetical protein